MKLFFILIFILSTSAFADWHLPRFNRGDQSMGGLRVVWSCPTPNRGNMPEEREVEIFYDQNGRASFRPDIFKASSNPLRALSNLFGRKKSSQDVGECLRTFVSSLPSAVTRYQQNDCNGLDTPVCTRAVDNISGDAGRTIRESDFFRKYQSDLSSVANLLPTPEVPPTPVTKTVGPTRVETPPPKREALVAETVDRQLYDSRAKARLLDYLVDNYSRIDDIQEFMKFCPDLGNTSGTNAEYCRDRFSRNQNFLNNLSQMFTSLRGENIGMTKTLQSIECLPARAEEFRDVEDILHSFDRRADCEPLPNVGDFKLFRKATGPAGYTSGNYLLKKTGEDTYEATLNLDFKSLGGVKNPEQMMATVRNCLAQSNPYLKGPGGARISIRALTPQETIDQIPAAERPFPGQINIQADQMEINSGNFTSNIDCPTVTHELLHHLGLCDEYKETRTNIVPGMTRSRAEEWSCRVVPNRPSIMKDHIEAFNAAVPQQFSCQCTTESCRTLFTAQDARSVAFRKTLMTAPPNHVLGYTTSSHCSEPVYMASTDNVPEPDKAYVDVNYSAGRLTFQHRLIFMDGPRLVVGRKNVTCSCPAGDSSCESQLARAAQIMPTNPQIETCPMFTTNGNKGPAPEGSRAGFTVDGNAITITTEPRASSLISPNQFDKILTGACTTSPSATFKRCSEFAYSSQDSSSCSQKPAECSNDNDFLGVSAQ